MAVLQSYKIQAKAEFELQLPVGCQILSFFNLDEEPHISVLVDISAPGREPRFFSMVDLKSTVDTSVLEKFIGVAVFRKGSNPFIFSKESVLRPPVSFVSQV